jgi:ADP-heptose:LPS heptosyltransferase
MKTISICRNTKKLFNGKRNAKEYPYWEELILLLKDSFEVREIVGEVPLDTLEIYIKESLTVICCDSFLQHFCWSLGKKAVVLWGKGDPLIYGHVENINLLKSRDNLRSNPFLFWEEEPYDEKVFVTPDIVMGIIEKEFIK